jgi:phosphoglycerate dehydrogenase-like enzyme
MTPAHEDAAPTSSDGIEVWFPSAPQGEFGEELRAHWPDGLTLREGPGAGTHARILVSGVPSPEELDAARALRHLVIPYAGLPRATRERMLERPQIAVHNLHHNAGPTAEHALALLFAVAKRVVEVDRHFRAGDWRMRWEGHGAVLLEGRQALVLGRGAIGQRVAQALEALGVRVRLLGRRDLPEARGREQLEVRLREELPHAEILILALPLTEMTERILNTQALELLPHGALLVNVGRGALIEEDALYAALVAGRVGAAGLDVWWRYPQSEAEREGLAPAEANFAALPQVVLTPHLAGHCDRTEALRASTLIELLQNLARDEDSVTLVDLEAGY